MFLQHTEGIYDVSKWQGIRNLSPKIGENIRYSLQIMNSRTEEAKLSLSLAATKYTVIKQTPREALRFVDDSSIFLYDAV
jgi:hypothetical protein